MVTRTRLNVKLIRTFHFMLTLNIVYKHDLKLLIVPSPWHTALDLDIFKLIWISFKLILYVIFRQVKTVKPNCIQIRTNSLSHSFMCKSLNISRKRKFFCVVCVKHVWNFKWIIQALEGDTSDRWFTTAFIQRSCAHICLLISAIYLACKSRVSVNRVYWRSQTVALVVTEINFILSLYIIWTVSLQIHTAVMINVPFFWEIMPSILTCRYRWFQSACSP